MKPLLNRYLYRMEKRVLLVILDGWGHGKDPKASAITQANTPFVDSLYRDYPNSELVTYGEEVGLPYGQMGNSEVGHLNLGAGRVVYQELARINKAIRERTLHEHPLLIKTLQKAHQENKAVHLMGLLSDGGVHSHINHLKALCDIIETHGPGRSYIHAFTDGRDVAPTSGIDYITDLQEFLHHKKTKLSTVIGRYYAMDRDNRWERIKLAYNLLTKGIGTPVRDFGAAIRQSYQTKDKDGKYTTDEFLPPLVGINAMGKPIATIQDGDVLICFNFRTDRPRQISQVLTQADMPEHDMHRLDLTYLTMTRYGEGFKNVGILFKKEDIKNTLGEVLAEAGRTQVRIAETEKYPHVTFFFSGGREAEYQGERRILIPSPKVNTYDLQPEMSAIEITDAIIKDIEQNQADFICLNYANTDMVGHTGIFEAAIKAVEIVDTSLKRLINSAIANDYTAIVIADHGNADIMVNEDKTPHTAHTTNPVPCFFINKNMKNVHLKNGKLADIAPTILQIMGIEQPEEMDGENLLF